MGNRTQDGGSAVGQIDTSDGFALIEDFAVESLDSLQAVPQLLETWRQNPDDPDPIHAAFRAVHSVKGCAACLGLEPYKQFAHRLEHTLAAIRDGRQPLTEPLQHALIEGFDCLDAMLGRVLHGEIVAEIGPEAQRLLEHIAAMATCPGESHETSQEEALLKQVQSVADEIARCGIPQAEKLAQRLRRLVGDILGCDTDHKETSPAVLSRRDPAEFKGKRFVYNGQDVTEQIAELLNVFLAIQEGRYHEETGQAFLEDAAEFADWAKQHGCQELAAALNQAAADFRILFDSPLQLDKDLISLVWDPLWPALARLEQDRVVPEAGSHSSGAPRKKAPAPRPVSNGQQPAAKARFVRVREERLDEFLEDVSSLFVTSELLKDLHQRMAETSQLTALVEELRQTHRDMKVQLAALQQSVMSLRRVSVSGLLSTFPRMARTLAKQLGKRINVHVSGEDTEIDKLVAEDLDAPLTHLVRNVVDHGIETPERRRARGVSETGNLWLRAEQTRNRVRILVEDDGCGIDPARLRRKAVEKGTCTQAQAEAMADEEALNLIFHPGFSTAEKVSEVSGRGVGLDVVRTTLAKHHGEVTVKSTPNVGTTFRLEIPIRQAVLVVDGLLVQQATQRFVVPFQHVSEIVQLDPNHIKSLQGQQVATIRGNCYPAVSLSRLLQLAEERPQPSSYAGVLVNDRHRTACLLVDSVVGHRQVVVKALDAAFAGLRNLAGVAQLGGNRLALVLNVPELIKNLSLDPGTGAAK